LFPDFFIIHVPGIAWASGAGPLRLKSPVKKKLKKIVLKGFKKKFET